MAIHLSIIFAAGVFLIVHWMSPVDWRSSPVAWVATGLLVFSLYHVWNGVVRLQVVRARGWRVGLIEFLGAHLEIAALRTDRIPWREEFAALPAYNPNDAEVENLERAIRLALGWTAETARESRLVPIYTASSPELAKLLSSLLAEEGFRAEAEETLAGGAYRFAAAGSKVFVPSSEADAARQFLDAYFAETPENLPED